MANAPLIIATKHVAKRAAQAGAVLILAISLGGCATNLTGFEFPSFGLFSDDEQSDMSQPGAMQSQSLTAAGGV